ncbi:hypothetical protein JW964_17705 [candidate division KSB1 bacterium]|nr:hypothetical protein [candidate division KSB1 bacterium]
MQTKETQMENIKIAFLIIIPIIIIGITLIGVYIISLKNKRKRSRPTVLINCHEPIFWTDIHEKNNQ